MKTAEMLQFCREKEHECRKLQMARTEMAHDWRHGSDAEWRTTARTTKSEFISSKRRKELAERDDRIAARYFAEAETYSAIQEFIERSGEL